MKHCFHLALVALALTSASPGALADMRATAAFSNFQYTVSDLRPNDGHDAALQVFGWSGMTSAFYVPAGTSNAEVQKVMPFTLNDPFPAESAIAPGTMTAGSASTGPGLLSAYVSGDGAALPAAGPGKTSPGIIGQAGGGFWFRLAPYSSVTLTLLGTITVERNGFDPDNLMIYPILGASVSTNYTERQDLTTQRWGGGPFYEELVQPFSFTVMNNSRDSLDATLGLGATAILAAGFARPVPEPASVALLLCGLCSLLPFARRR
jgi:hypothetical protein